MCQTKIEMNALTINFVIVSLIYTLPTQALNTSFVRILLTFRAI